MKSSMGILALSLLVAMAAGSNSPAGERTTLPGRQVKVAAIAMQVVIFWLAAFIAMATLAQTDDNAIIGGPPIKLCASAKLRNGEKQVVRFSAAKGST